MNKEEFLDELRSCLSGKLPPAEVESNIDYYRAYIEGEIMRGRSEQDVLEELGPARFIAKTLTANIKENTADQEDEGGNRSSGYGQDQTYENGPSQEEYANERPSHMGLRKVASVIIGVLIVLLVFFLVFYVFRGALWLFFRFLPIIIIIALFSFIMRGTNRRR